jgi:hypothetical protein
MAEGLRCLRPLKGGIVLSKAKLLILGTFIIIILSSIFWGFMSNKKNNILSTIDDINGITHSTIKDIKIIDGNNSGFSKSYERNNQISEIMSIIKAGQYSEGKKTESESGGWSLSVKINLKDEKFVIIYFTESTMQVKETVYRMNSSEVLDNIYDYIYQKE